jgi:hypothetical protein
MTVRLCAARHPGAVSAADALAWFAAGPRAGSPDGGEVIGYLLAPDRAEWFRCDGAVPRGPGAPRNLSDAFEVYATDGARQLRWGHEAAGRGWAAGLAQDAALLPPGQALPQAPERLRLDGTRERLLAGRVVAVREAWVTLATARYAPCDVPVAAAPGDEVWARLAEYATRDEHGNLSVADTLLLSLTARLPSGTKEPLS